MGYDIHGWKTMWKEEIGYVGCNYAWQPNFKKYLGFDIKELNGRVTKKNLDEMVMHMDKIIEGLRNETESKNFMGSLSNSTNEQMIEGFISIRDGIADGRVRYFSVS